MKSAILSSVLLCLSVASVEAQVHPYYNNSAFDRFTEAVTSHDVNAIAFDKVALRTGQTATFRNYTSYGRGINGVVVLGASDDIGPVSCRVGNDSNVAAWKRVSSPRVEVIGGVAYMTWPEGLIRNTWLELSIGGEVYYFGNAVGEVGNSTRDAIVNVFDYAGVRDNPRTPLDPAPIDDEYDINRDALVDKLDNDAVAANATNFITALKLITP